MQINIETDEVDVLRMKKLRRREGSEGAKCVLIDGFGFLDEFFNKTGYPGGPAPTHNFGRDFIDDTISENGGKPFAGRNCLADGAERFRARSGGVEKAEVLRPRNIDQHLEFMFGGQLQKPWRRNIINTDEIDAQSADLFEVTSRLLAARKSFTVVIRSERTVCHAFYAELPGPQPKELSIHDDALGRHGYRQRSWSGGVVEPPTPGAAADTPPRHSNGLTFQRNRTFIRFFTAISCARVMTLAWRLSSSLLTSSDISI